jgi:hypothetical protein
MMFSATSDLNDIPVNSSMFASIKTNNSINTNAAIITSASSH